MTNTPEPEIPFREPDPEELEATGLANKAKAEEALARAASRPPVKHDWEPVPKGMKVGQIIQKAIRGFLEVQDPQSKDQKTRLLSVIEGTYKRAIDQRSGQGKASAELLLAYGYEKPQPAVNELEALAKSGLQVVFVERGGLETVPKMGALPEPRPEFLEGEILEEEGI